MIINNYYLQTSLINKEPDPCPLATLPSLIPASSQLVPTLSLPRINTVLGSSAILTLPYLTTPK